VAFFVSVEKVLSQQWSVTVQWTVWDHLQSEFRLCSVPDRPSTTD